MIVENSEQYHCFLIIPVWAMRPQPGTFSSLVFRYDFDPSTAHPEIEMAELACGSRQDDRIAGRDKSLDLARTDRADLAGGENILGRPWGKRGQHMRRVAVIMNGMVAALPRGHRNMPKWR
ncbi:hypothetical protein ROE7235_03014 [Roseibaca ekhonensis]|uniref:Uncharacterized protein n=1 Tax=Roseinatronobacter ekhonensis TaxID=254356 RepID=A0A3B0MBD9_9RHOB|nr:hypothetical protein ROE7235_03014 [Roseibaca ekhonensis]